MNTEKAIRNTKQRKQLLNLLCSTKTHPSALWLYECMREIFPGLSLSTVYRNLGILEKQGLLIRLPCANFDRYDADTKTHSHFYCKSCERVFDLEERREAEKRKPETNHCVEGCTITYNGVCEKCLPNYKEDLQ